MPSAAAEKVAEAERAERRETNRQGTALSLAVDVIEDALGGNFDLLNLRLLQIWEARLVEHRAEFHAWLSSLVNDGEKLQERVRVCFPESHSPRHWNTRRAYGTTIAREAEFYRQETYWLNHAIAEATAGEQCVRDLFQFFEAAAVFMNHLDAINENGRSLRRPAPPLTPNPFAPFAIKGGAQ